MLENELTLSPLDYIHGALETAEQCLLDSVGPYGKEEARAWIWAVLTELEELRREEAVHETAADVWEQARRAAARWPRDEGEMRNDAADMLEAAREARG